ncbi:glycosyltransferase family 2 protein [uncultured Cohaesibacter sp.]|uniref:glycosyltransferase family 2 protein n=1 Tax=uncultured Cohaesibacter sp. TaxID=1002546 RepID=UPI0029C8E903|nr:glycosyltransferase family 2 protein [uncultured Cohaesibacter sp.]
MSFQHNTGPFESKVSCIIPTFNEAPRILAVLDIVRRHPQINEVIVVDDGSTDGTASIVASVAGVRLFRMPRNGGKTKALAKGFEMATGSHILLVDADLIGLNGDDLTALINPVLTGTTDISISLRRNAPRLWHWVGIDYISGERCMKASLVSPYLGELESLPKFGFEVWLNDLCIMQSARISVVLWDGVVSPSKVSKMGRLKGVLADFGMIGDLFRKETPWQLVKQIWKMEKLKTDRALCQHIMTAQLLRELV